MEYIKQFYDKPSHLNWETFYSQVNAQFKQQQQKSIEQNAEKCKIREENEWQKQLQLEKEKRKKEEKDKLALQQQLEVQQKLKQEQEEREQREWESVEEAQQLAKLEEERKDNEARKAVEQIAQNAAADFLELEDDNDDCANTQPDGPVLPHIKQEKDETSDPKSETKSKEELFNKIFDLNQADYRIALKNYDLNKALEAYLHQVGGLVLDPDVLYALKNLKELGHTMRVQKEGSEKVGEGHETSLLSVSVHQNGQPSCQLFPETTPGINNS